MDLRTLRTFHTIVTTGSFHRAAEEMNYAQSTVTMQMQKLESDLGVQLIERGKKIRLTEAGRLLYEQSVPIVRNMELLQTSLADVQRGDAGHVRLGVTEPAASYRLPAIVGSFLSRYPNIRISIEVANTVSLSERLRAGELDLALCSAPDLGSELYFAPLFQEEFTVLLPLSKVSLNNVAADAGKAAAKHTTKAEPRPSAIPALQLRFKDITEYPPF
jgi:DNA-binding transcriptional LysR family regulator